MIEDFEQLLIDAKEYAVGIIKKQRIEVKREALAKRAKEAMSRLKKCRVKKWTIKEFYKDLKRD